MRTSQPAWMVNLHCRQDVRSRRHRADGPASRCLPMPRAGGADPANAAKLDEGNLSAPPACHRHIADSVTAFLKGLAFQIAG